MISPSDFGVERRRLAQHVRLHQADQMSDLPMCETFVCARDPAGARVTETGHARLWVNSRTSVELRSPYGARRPLSQCCIRSSDARPSFSLIASVCCPPALGSVGLRLGVSVCAWECRPAVRSVAICAWVHLCRTSKHEWTQILTSIGSVTRIRTW